MVKSSLFVLLITFANVALAVDLDRKKNILGVGISYGGDALGYIGDDELNAGEDLSLFYGRIFLLENYRQFQVNVGFKDDIVTASNAEQWFYRFPVELLLFQRVKSIRYGGGITYHINPSYETEFNGTKSENNFDNAIGFVIQIDYLNANYISGGVRYENISYSSPQQLVHSQTGEVKSEFDGNSVGVFVRYHF